MSPTTAPEDDIDGVRRIPEKVGELHHPECNLRGDLPRLQVSELRQSSLTFSLIILGNYSPQIYSFNGQLAPDGAVLAVRDHNNWIELPRVPELRICNVWSAPSV
jgi:hypothetical protein